MTRRTWLRRAQYVLASVILLAPPVTALAPQAAEAAVPAPAVARALPAGWTELQLTSENSGKCMDVAHASGSAGAAVQQYHCNSTEAQWWFQIPVATDSAGNTYYRFLNAHSGLCLEVAGGSTQAGAPMQQYSCNDWYNQEFRVYGWGRGNLLVARHSNMCVEVPDSSTDDWVQLRQAGCSLFSNQIWDFEVVIDLRN